MPGVALVLCLLLNQGFDWPRRAEQLVNALTSASTPRDRRDALRLLGELAARTGLPKGLDLTSVEAASQNLDADVRADAWSLLAQLRPVPDSLVEPALHDPSPTVRRVAVRELGRLAPDHESLLRSVTDVDPGVRAVSVALLAQRSDARAGTVLASALRDVSIEVRVAAVRALGQRREADALALAASAADDPLPELRVAALDGLALPASRFETASASGSGPRATARVDTPIASRAATVCVRALDDADQAVVLGGLRCLERARSTGEVRGELAPAAHDPRVQALAGSFFPVVASAATHLLARDQLRRDLPEAGHTPAWLPLLERTADHTLTAVDAAHIVDALETIVPAGETLVADPLLEWLPRAPRALAPRVAALIERSRATIATQPVLALLDATPDAARASYVRLLASTRGPETDARLLALLDDRRPDVHHAAVFAAARALGNDTLPQLLERLEDTSDPRRRDALAVLAALLDRPSRPARDLPSSTARALLGVLRRELAGRDEVRAALAIRALGSLDVERARDLLRGTLTDARAGRSIAALRASARDRSVETRRQRARLLTHGDPRVAASALIALTLAGDPIPTKLAESWLHDAPWPQGPAASFALKRAMSRNDASMASFSPCEWLASDEPITRRNMMAALARQPSPACPRRDLPPWQAWLVQHAGSARRPDEPAALLLEDSSVIVSVPDASGQVGWPTLTVATEVSAFLASDGSL